mmetsp:Transcript_2698/g.4200  ORF Transcript_2698/g.4200 Transcript_2698/m.4200 type:complete len:137 (+) Transcript_2698:59-469(+)
MRNEAHSDYEPLPSSTLYKDNDGSPTHDASPLPQFDKAAGKSRPEQAPCETSEHSFKAPRTERHPRVSSKPTQGQHAAPVLELDSIDLHIKPLAAKTSVVRHDLLQALLLAFADETLIADSFGFLAHAANFLANRL